MSKKSPTRYGSLLAFSFIIGWSLSLSGCKKETGLNSVKTEELTPQQVKTPPTDPKTVAANTLPPAASVSDQQTNTIMSESLPSPTPPIKTSISTRKTPPAPIEKAPAKQSEAEKTAFKENRTNLDPSNPSFNMLQKPSDAMADFPLDNFGRINWVKALKMRSIAPRAQLDSSGQMKSKEDAVIMKNTLAMPYVRFPHKEHTQWLDCSNCHPTPFKAQEGANNITMESIMRGEHCGMCHERVAFGIMACERCHSITHPGSPKKWW